jgi:uncharacterized membrane protein YccC
VRFRSIIAATLALGAFATLLLAPPVIAEETPPAADDRIRARIAELQTALRQWTEQREQAAQQVERITGGLFELQEMQQQLESAE